MAGEVRDECGIAAVYLPKGEKGLPSGGASYALYKMLIQMQNRGQLSAGITTYNKNRHQLIDTYKGLGTVNEAFNYRNKRKMDSILRQYAGNKGIGHVRYATCGEDDKGAAQPFERKHGRMWKWFAFGFNGNLANFAELKKELGEKDYHLIRNLDTEVIMHTISKAMVGSKRKNILRMLNNMSGKFDGAYNLVYLNAEGTMFASRDPLGIRPLSYVMNRDFVGAASESVALQNFSKNGVESLKPGTALIVEDGHANVKRYAKSKRTAHCMFEWVYFANAASVIDGISVYTARRNLGKELARVEPLETKRDNFVVVGVPDTAKPCADSYAHELGLESMEGLMRNRYIGRTFIEGADRANLAREKYNLNKEVLRGKRVILIEDSIVRGTTTKAIVERIKKEGKAKEVHVRSSAPPIKSPCFYGIDMSTMNELIACRHAEREDLKNTGMEDLPEKTIRGIAREIKADSLQYQTIEGLVKGIGMPSKKLCMACLTGDYPTPCGKMLAKMALKNLGKKENGRTYEQYIVKKGSYCRK